MNVKGKIQLSFLEYTDVELNVKYGKINEINIPDVSPLVLSSLGIKQSSDYTFEKHYDSQKAPYKSNYYIRYYGGSEKQQIIFLKLNLLQIMQLRYSMRKWLIQSDDMKKDILKYIIGGLLGYGGGLFIQYVNANNNDPVTTLKAESQKSLENKYLKTETKKDTIIIKKIKNTSDLNGAEVKPKIEMNKKPKA
ncbi:MAG: hypothetical protein PHF81_08360 [Flavobacterium sp.]|nr:hypothetical protein [Flavobacterium sp.]